MTINEALKNAIEKLKESHIENPVQISKILLAELLHKPKEYLLVNENEILNGDTEKQFIDAIEKIKNGIPLQYVTHKQEFMKMELYVDENVLIPRSDTEILVEEALNLIKDKENLNILDMCTGSGAIAISIAKYTKNNTIYAVDISKNALEVAKKNAAKNDVDIQFINSNMFENIDKNFKFDIIISNPPYIETDVIATLDIQVQNEPKIALDGGIDGLEFYRNILKNSEQFLKPNGIICMEIGYNQAETVTDIFKGKFKTVYCKKDLAGNNRVIVAKN